MEKLNWKDVSAVPCDALKVGVDADGDIAILLELDNQHIVWHCGSDTVDALIASLRKAKALAWEITHTAPTGGRQ